MGKRNYIINAENIASDLLACKRAFARVKIPWIITDGIILGYARYKKILEWDTDLDIAVFVKINYRQWTNLYKSLTTEDFIVKKNKSDFMTGGRLTPLNMWFFHKRGNFYESFPPTTRGFKFVEKAIWYDEPQMIEFLGSEYPMPNNINDYLDNHYGNDWPTNIIKGHKEWRVNKMGEYAVVTEKSLSGRSGKGGDLWPKVIRINDTMEIDE